MKLLEYRFLTIDDHYDSSFVNWSRCYEYPSVLFDIGKTKGGMPIKVHNTSWGSTEIHAKFRSKLDEISESIHTDIIPSEVKGYDTTFYDITKNEPSYKDKFDIVLNISVIEHLPSDKHLPILRNLFDQIKPGGKLICTFDYPGIDLNSINSFLGYNAPCDRSGNILSGSTSRQPNMTYRGLNIIYFSVQK